MSPPPILLYHPEADAYAALMRARTPDVDLVATSDVAELRRRLRDAEVLVTHRFPVAVLDDAPRLRWIQVTIAGTEFLGPPTDRLRTLVVTNGRGIHAAPIADYTMAAMTMLHSDFAAMFRDQQAKRWRRRPVVALERRTLGIVGLGAIGREIGRRAKGAGMRVIGVRRVAAPVEGFDTVVGSDALRDVLPQCDFVAISVPLTDATRGLLGAREIEAMKRGAYLVNTSRGGVVDESALAAALASGTLGGACLDVFETEPLPEASPFWTLPNVIVTPHIAGMRTDYAERFADLWADAYAAWLRGGPLPNVVDFDRGY